MKVMWQARGLPEEMTALIVVACQKEQETLMAAEGAACGRMPEGTEDADCS
jgi:hypothetical protein